VPPRIARQLAAKLLISTRTQPAQPAAWASGKARMAALVPASNSLSPSLTCYGTLPGMGNKDSHRREKKKPKKQTPKLATPPRTGYQTTTPPVVTRNNENK